MNIFKDAILQVARTCKDLPMCLHHHGVVHLHLKVL